jgi:hypothetical protein
MATNSNLMFRVVMIVGAIVVLGTVLYWYNGSVEKTTSPKKETFYESLAIDQPSHAPMRSFPALAGDEVASPPPGTVQPSEEQAGDNSGFKAVDFEASKNAQDACFPRDRLTAADLLPSEDAANSKWAQVNPAGQGDVANNNFLSAGWAVGINTVSGSLRNANLQIRSEPANPRGSWPIMNSTIVADQMRRPLEIGSSECGRPEDGSLDMPQ